MSKNLTTFFVVFLISLPIFWGINVFQKNLEDFLFWQEIADNPQILTAQISSEIQWQKLKPIRNRQIPALEIEAKSAIAVLMKPDGSQKILFEKEKDKILPIASLTKLMTANIVLDNYNLSQFIEINEQAIKEKEETGNFKIGEIFLVEQLLYPLLMESSNDAAIALAEVIGKKAFVDLMNLEVKNLGLENTHFVNPTGLDPDNPQGSINHSTAKDLVKLASHLLKENPLIWEILSLSEFNFLTEDGVFHHKIINTNKLLAELPTIIGGKTGTTPRSGNCLLLVVKAPKNKGYLINVILGAKEGRFEEMKKLINWLNAAHKW